MLSPLWEPDDDDDLDALFAEEPDSLLIRGTNGADLTARARARAEAQVAGQRLWETICVNLRSANDPQR